MNFQSKIKYLEEQLKLNDHSFALRYKIRPSIMRKLMDGRFVPQLRNVTEICKEFKLDPKDFLDDTSTIAKEVKEDEHPCKFVKVEDSSNVIYEDFAREDNSRYEEKD